MRLSRFNAKDTQSRRYGHKPSFASIRPIDGSGHRALSTTMSSQGAQAVIFGKCICWDFEVRGYARLEAKVEVWTDEMRNSPSANLYFASIRSAARGSPGLLECYEEESTPIRARPGSLAHTQVFSRSRCLLHYVELFPLSPKRSSRRAH